MLAGPAQSFHARAAMTALNDTHDPNRKSWVESANRAGTDFPIQNLPFAVFRRANSAEALRAGVAIGEQILDLGALHQKRALAGSAGEALAACAEPPLNRFMALGEDAWSTLRAALATLLEASGEHAARNSSVGKDALVPQSGAEY